MSRRAFRGGMIVLALVAALALAGADPASAAGHQPSWWQRLASLWGKAGAEIDPNGNHIALVTPPVLPGPLTPAPKEIKGVANPVQGHGGVKPAPAARGSKG